jgi:uncharacterized protein (DUF1501 family)
LLRAATGPRIAVLSVDGWDTHSDQAESANPLVGDMADRMTELNEAIGDLKNELGPVWENTVAICVTEFGRTVETNGSRGTDHGIGTASIIVGGAVQGNQVIGDWPGLAPEFRLEDALRPTVDLRAVFKSILNQHIGVPTGVLDDIVFPGSASAKLSAKLISGPKRAERLASSFKRPLTPQDVAPIAQYRKLYGLDS